jgi:hypothetical protein
VLGGDREELAAMDRDFGLNRDDGDFTRVTLVADGYPPNLAQEQWPDRYAVTACAVELATLQLAGATQPGVQALDRAGQRFLVSAARRLGLGAPRELEKRPTARDLSREQAAVAVLDWLVSMRSK